MLKKLVPILLVMSLFAAACGTNDVAVLPPEDAETPIATTVPVAQAPGDTKPDAPEAEAPPEPVVLEPLDQLRIYHPPVLAFAAPFTMLDTTGALADVSNEVNINTWATPDVVRTILVNENSEVTAVPTYVGANLFNRGVDVRLAAVIVWGMLWLIGPDGTPATWESLRGQTVMVPFPNDMPDLVFRHLAIENGLIPGEDFEIQYFVKPPEVVAQLVSGKGTWAVLPEHAATMSIVKANKNNQNIGRVLDLQAEWAKATGADSPRIPQAGIVVPGWIADERPDVIAALLDELEKSVETVNAKAPATLGALSEVTGMPAPIIGQIIPRLNLEVVPGAEARVELERFFKELASLYPDIIGGVLPDAKFYIEDPR